MRQISEKSTYTSDHDKKLLALALHHQSTTIYSQTKEHHRDTHIYFTNHGARGASPREHTLTQSPVSRSPLTDAVCRRAYHARAP